MSGTAKGKAKIKAQALKCSKVTIKKGADASAGGGVRKGSLAVELEEMVDKCINAPTPIRFLRPKQKACKSEREKLGLVSKEWKREMEMMKKQAHEGTGFENSLIKGTSGLDLISLVLIDADQILKYDLTVEDGCRLAKEYSRVLMRRHRARQKPETTLLRMKKEAATLVPDLSKFQANRFMATLTSSIEGYLEKVMEASKKTSGKEKLR